MALRGLLEASPATISDFVVAAEARFREAVDISHLGHYSAAIYLIGYAAEMWLKAAAFITEGARPFDIVEPRLAPARRWLADHPWQVAYESYHSLLFWANYLRAGGGRRETPFHT